MAFISVIKKVLHREMPERAVKMLKMPWLGPLGDTPDAVDIL